MDEDTLNKLERISIRIFLIAILLWITFILFRSCSSSIVFLKGDGQGHEVRISEGTDAAVDVSDIDLALRKVESGQRRHEKILNDSVVLLPPNTKESVQADLTAGRPVNIAKDSLVMLPPKAADSIQKVLIKADDHR